MLVLAHCPIDPCAGFARALVYSQDSQLFFGRSIGLLYQAANHSDLGGAIARGKSPQGTGDKPRWPSAKMKNTSVRQ
jgi:hypothetical protein